MKIVCAFVLTLAACTADPPPVVGEFRGDLNLYRSDAVLAHTIHDVIAARITAQAGLYHLSLGSGGSVHGEDCSPVCNEEFDAVLDDRVFVTASKLCPNSNGTQVDVVTLVATISDDREHLQFQLFLENDVDGTREIEFSGERTPL